MVKKQSISSLKKIVSILKQKGKTIVFTNGCFDLIHPGHIKIIKEAKKKGDVLIVGLNSDKSVKKIKGKTRPLLNQKARATILSAIQYIDYLTIFDQKTPYLLIKALKPDILVKGQDWPKDKIIGRKLVKKIVQLKMSPGYSTTNIIKKIKKHG
ncbi:MAG: adenylyltransferase/cytidyltransferase family protein [Candidatus Omnitrophica bacterium]|nr:adenylyltransferase/cytidyltransferase family protein [Candidatus Omnitrophota bacterium]MCF7877216.1 adenylyltransferase/cytidyltransferase family protein [Candidatus Omnitrophota bacterium]MCF7878077.1 adenylyltransferase/cytidyltransferase family protein [Candidatus Omnitrophota bacterium]